MEKQLIEILAILIAGSIIMIVHELPKAIVYNMNNKEQSLKQKNAIFKVFNYIDPIGLIFCVTTHTGFSKPYMYRIKEKKTNFLLGITGFVSLIIIFAISLTLVKVNAGKNSSFTSYSNIDFFFKYLIYSIMNYTTLISISMIFVNLFPVSTFDMGLLIAGKSPDKYFSIIKNDYYIKMILIFAIIFGIIETFSRVIITLFL